MLYCLSIPCLGHKSHFSCSFDLRTVLLSGERANHLIWPRVNELVCSYLIFYLFWYPPFYLKAFHSVQNHCFNIYVTNSIASKWGKSLFWIYLCYVSYTHVCVIPVASGQYYLPTHWPPRSQRSTPLAAGRSMVSVRPPTRSARQNKHELLRAKAEHDSAPFNPETHKPFPSSISIPKLASFFLSKWAALSPDNPAPTTITSQIFAVIVKPRWLGRFLPTWRALGKLRSQRQRSDSLFFSGSIRLSRRGWASFIIVHFGTVNTRAADLLGTESVVQIPDPNARRGVWLSQQRRPSSEQEKLGAFVAKY